jgi:hypothetical protein
VHRPTQEPDTLERRRSKDATTLQAQTGNDLFSVKPTNPVTVCAVSRAGSIGTRPHSVADHCLKNTTRRRINDGGDDDDDGASRP